MRKEAMLSIAQKNGCVQCVLCAHRCVIPEGGTGICKVRQNQNGVLYSLIYGQVISAAVDPIEKKPLYHFLPGSYAYSIAMQGCNFQCHFCQNWEISQFSYVDMSRIQVEYVSPHEVVAQAKASGCKSIAYTYTEPTVFFEYVYDVARLAHKEGIRNVFVTNGFMTKEAFEIIAPYVDAANIDLKSFQETYYRHICHARLAPVLDTIRRMKKAGIWIEITTLIVPEENDSEEELNTLTQFLVDVNPSIPWHVSKFYPCYMFQNKISTPLTTLEKAKEIGNRQGLQHVYLGNVARGNDTYCVVCKRKVVERIGYSTHVVGIDEKGNCIDCHNRLEGVWE